MFESIYKECKRAINDKICNFYVILVNSDSLSRNIASAFKKNANSPQIDQKLNISINNDLNLKNLSKIHIYIF